MGSAIGDFYVHLHARNYNKAGLFRLREGTRQKYNYQQKITEVNNKMPQAQVNPELIENLQRLMGKGNPEEDQKTIIAVQQAIEQILGKNFQEKLGTINWSTLDVSKEKMLRDKNIITAKIKASDKKDYIYLKTIMSRVRAIEQLQKNITSAMQREKLQALLNQIYRNIKQILNSTGTKTTLQELRALNIQDQSFNPIIKWNEASTNLVQMINETIRLYAIKPLISLQKGDLLEYAISGAWILAQINAGKQIDDIVREIEKQVTGKKSSNIKVDFTKLGITEEMSFKDIEMKGYVLDEYKKVAWAVLPTQEKVDVQIDFQGGKQAISAKNVNLALGYNISLVSGSPLSYLIQDEDTEFKGHYLNLVASHADTIIINQNHTLAHQAMKYVILFKALAGGTYGRPDIADTFILNDNKTGQLYVYSIEQLFNKAKKNLNLYTSVTVGGPNGTPLERMIIDNTRQHTWQDRMLYYIRNVHQQKVYASFSSMLFNEKDSLKI